jgi:hypothetical protein
VTKSMDAATSQDSCSRCRHRLLLQSLLPLSLIPFSSSRSQSVCNQRTGFCIPYWDRQVIKNAERSGSASNAGCEAGYDATSLVCLCHFAGCCCVTTGCTQRGGWSNHGLLLCCGRGGSRALSDICNTRIVQRR